MLNKEQQSAETHPVPAGTQQLRLTESAPAASCANHETDRLQSQDSDPGSLGSFQQPAVPLKHLMSPCRFIGKGRVPPFHLKTEWQRVTGMEPGCWCHLVAACLSYWGAGVSKGKNHEHFIRAVLSRVRFCATPWTEAHQAPLSMRFSRQEYQSGLPCPPPGDLPNPGIKPRSPAPQAESLPSEPPGKPHTLLSL